MPRKKPAPPPSTQRGEATRAKIVEAAYGLFLKHGFHGASMRQIANGAGLALGGIYNHFASKEEIFAAVLDDYHPYHTVMPALEQSQGETVEAFMRDAASRIHESVKGSETRLMPLVFIEVVEFQGRHLKDLAERLFPSLLGFLQRLSERQGELRSLPLPVLLRTFLGLMIGYLLTEMVLRNSPLFKQMNYDWFGGMVEIYLHGILAEPEAR